MNEFLQELYRFCFICYITNVFSCAYDSAYGEQKTRRVLCIPEDRGEISGMTGEAFEGISGQRIGCPHCGGGLRFDIQKQDMLCTQCGSRFPTEQFRDSPADDGMMEAVAYRCPQCGADIYTAGDTEATGRCMFCGSDVVLTGRLARFQRPEALVPFRITRERCEEIYRKHLAGYHLSPPELRLEEVASAFQPVYVPFWRYEISASGQTDGFVGYRIEDHPDETIHKKYRIKADVRVNTGSPVFDASREFEDETGHRLSYDPKQAVPFRSCYLSGFYAQGADMDPETYQRDAKAFASVRLMDCLEACCEPRLSEVDVWPEPSDSSEQYSSDWGLPNAQWKAHLVMMPVWLLTRRSEGRVLYTAINGMNGTIVCDPPVNHARVAALTLLVAAALFVLLQLFVNLRAPVLAVISGVLAAISQTLLAPVLERVWRRDHPSGTESEGEAYMAVVRKAARNEEKGFRKKKDMMTGCLTAMLRPLGFMLLSVAVISFLASLARGADGYRPYFIVTLIFLAWLCFQHFRRKRPVGAQAVFRYAVMGLLVLLAFLYNTRQFEDLLYYGVSVAFLLCSVIPVTLRNRDHNTYVSRPVPFFGEKGENA